MLLGVLAGCSADGAGDGGTAGLTVMRVDSASVQLVTDPRPGASLAEVWTLPADPVLTLGDEDGDEPFLFSRIGDVVPLSGGVVAVANGGSRELRLFRADGEHLRSVGGAGDGPGRFGTLEDVRRVGQDTLLAWDSRNLRLSRITAGDGFVESVPLEVSAGFPPPRIELLSDGSLVVSSGLPDFPDLSRAGWHARHDSLLVQLIPAGGGEVRTIGRFADVSRASGFVDLGEGPMAIQRIEIPFGTRTLTTTLGDRTIVAHNGDFALNVFDRGGALGAIWRFPGLVEPLTPAEMARFLEPAGDGVAARIMGDLIDRFVTAAERPAFDRILAASTDEIWVRRYRWDPDEEHVWWVVSGVGELLGLVRVPAHLEVRAVDHDRLFAVSEDDLGVQRVEVYVLNGG